MQAEKKSRTSPKKKTKTAIFLTVLAFVSILILSVIFVVPAFVSSKTGREIILTEINNSIDGRIDFAALSMSWTKGLTVTDFSFDDSAGRTFVKAKQILTKPHYVSLLKGRLLLEETLIKDIQINDATAEVLLKYVNPIFADAVNVTGVANFSSEQLVIPLTDANKEDLEVVGTIAVDNLKLQPQGLLGQIVSLIGLRNGRVYITVHPTSFVLRNGFLRYDDMQVDVGDNPVNFKGVIGLDKSLNMTVTLPYTLKGTTARVDKETAGERITIQLKGTIDKPELDVDKLLEEQLKQLLEEKLEERFGEKLEEQLGEELKEVILEGLDKLLKKK